MKPILCLILFSTLPGLASAIDLLAPDRLSVEYLENPLGIDTPRPRLSWQLRSPHPNARGLRQSAFQIQVSSAPELLAADQPDLWNSGKAISDQSHLVEYDGCTLRSQQRVSNATFIGSRWSLWSGRGRPRLP